MGLGNPAPPDLSEHPSSAGNRPRKRGRPTISLRRAAAGAALVLALLWVLATGFLFAWPSSDSAGRVDALIVLGPGRNGERIEKALELMRSGASNVLVVSEGNGAAWRRVEDVCTRPTSFQIVCFRATPFTTRGEAAMGSRLATARGWGEIAVVTSTYHITRARVLWSRCYDGSCA